jgi:hypothetical protein
MLEFVDIPRRPGKISNFITPIELELGPYMQSAMFHIEMKPLMKQIAQKISDFMKERTTYPKLLILWEVYHKALEIGVPTYIRSIRREQWLDFEIKQTIVENIVEVF